MVTDVSGSSRGFTAGGVEKLPGSAASSHASSCCGCDLFGDCYT